MIAYRGKTALVTGASSGIGEAFARGLAARGMRVFLTARPEDQSALQAVATDITTTTGVETGVFTVDLGERNAAEALQGAADAAGFEPDLLVNNAGVMTNGAIGVVGVGPQLAMVRVNIEALVALTTLYLPRMLARHHGAIVNVGSVAGLQPVPYSAVYAASKSFVHSFSEALWAETHATGVRVLAVCPGPVPETALRHSQREEAVQPRSFQVMQAAGTVLRALGRRPLTLSMIVESALTGLEQDQPLVLRRAPGAALIHLPLSLLGAVVPRRNQLRTLERLFRPKSS